MHGTAVALSLKFLFMSKYKFIEEKVETMSLPEAQGILEYTEE